MRFGAGLEGGGPSPPRFAVSHTASRRRRSGRPPGNRPAMAHPFRCRPGGRRSLAAAVRRYPHRFTAPTERAPSRESAGNGPSVSSANGLGFVQPCCRVPHGAYRSRKRIAAHPPSIDQICHYPLHGRRPCSFSIAGCGSGFLAYAA